MNGTASGRVPLRDLGFVVAGLVAGGITAAVTNSVIPPALVAGVAIVVAMLADRREG